MISIRIGFFETNSSSVHVLVIPKDTKLTIPNVVYLRGGEYGWDSDKDYDTLDYFYQACADRGRNEVDKFINYLYSKGVETIHCREIDNQDIENNWRNMGYIDHGSQIPLDDLFSNESLLDRFLFGNDSFVETGNDNSSNCPDEANYDPDIYDTIEKGN